MTTLTEESAEQILRASGENVEQLAESLNQCFDQTLHLEVGSAGIWDTVDVGAAFRLPGVVTVFEFDGQAAACLVPAEIGLPDWHRSPNDSQRARLENLAVEWSMNVFPSELIVTRSTTRAVDDLAQFVAESVPLESATTLALHAVANGTRCGTMLLVWPLLHPALEVAAPAVPVMPTRKTLAPPAAAATPPVDPLARFRGMPVQISVRLAEKRIPVSQLLGITPGALITFNKPCEDLLDLYVNNALYCRGEAVKIGESFGLKVNHVGAVPQRVTKILNG
jgi:flagellar motor switch protein FliN/FliY